MKVDQRYINGVNKNNVLEMIRMNEPISRAEIARRTKLSLPTIMKITDELVAQGVLIDNIKGKSTGGKPPKLLCFNYQVGYIIGVDIDYHRIDAILMDLDASLVQEISHDIHSQMTYDTFLDLLQEVLEFLVREAEKNSVKLLGIGISMTEILAAAKKDSESQVLQYDCTEEKLKEILKKKFNLPVYFENRIYAKAIGEKMVGNAQQIGNFIFVNLGYEIEAALVLENGVYHGDRGLAGNIGCLTVGEKCQVTFGEERMTLNEVAGQEAIGKRARKAISNLDPDDYSMMLDLEYGQIKDIDFYTVIEAAESGDRLATEILCDAASAVGYILCNTVLLLDLRVIVISGKIVDCSKMFTKELREYIRIHQPDSEDCAIEIRTSNLGRHIGAIGAASNVLNRFLKDGMKDV